MSGFGNLPDDRLINSSSSRKSQRFTGTASNSPRAVTIHLPLKESKMQAFLAPPVEKANAKS
jgi:hypothetical protein